MSGNAESPPNWQPIETAPKDGSDVMLWATVGQMMDANNRCVVGRYARGWWLSGANAVLSHATHWMPLPVAPGMTAAARQAGSVANDAKQEIIGVQLELETIGVQLDMLRSIRDRHELGSELRGMFNAVCDRVDVLRSLLANAEIRGGEAVPLD
jgi:hypothetical protein